MDEQQDLFTDAFARHEAVFKKTLESVLPDTERAAEILLEAAKNGRRVFACGNGGSAADSQHFVAEWTCRYKDDREPLAAIALTTDTSALTAIGNDYSFEEIFSRPLSALGNAGDVLVGFTTSGTSKNVLKAFATAKKKNMKTIAFTGEGGISLQNIVDVAIIIPDRETARIQEMHEIIYHAICEYVDAGLKNAALK